MKQAKLLIAGIAIAGVLAGGGLYWAGVRHGEQSAASNAPAARANASENGDGNRVLYWHDPMVPGQKFDKPGKSPFMDMQLVPVYADERSDNSGVTVNARVQQNLGIRTAVVARTTLSLPVQAVGSVAYNEREIALVQARSNGYIERLYVRAALDPVQKGERLAELYVPDWVAAQEEYFTVKRLAVSDPSLLDGARQRMRLSGMTDDLIRQVEATGKVQSRLTITAPRSGLIGELTAREGMTVASGAPLFRINGLGTVWVDAEVPEGQAALVKPGTPAQVRAAAWPGTVFNAKVSALLPEVNLATRTLRARIEVANPGARLTPGMYASISLDAASQSEVLTVPSEAVIQTGMRSVVMVAEAEGKFHVAEVQIGNEANGNTEIRAGLKAGQRVVVSGQFLIDSEASLKGATTRMQPPTTDAPPKTPPAVAQGEGTVERIEKGEITLSHGPIPSLKWGAMTMGFMPPPTGVPKNIAVGDRVSFSLRPSDDGMYQLVDIARRSGAAPKEKAQ